MSMNFSVAGARAAALLVAALMIGCGNSERNSIGAPGEAGQVGASAEGVSFSAPDAEGEAATAPGTVLFVGTSLTAGQGLPEQQSFPSLIERRLDEAGLRYRVVNAGVSGETSAGALARIDWLLRQPFDVVVLETGANDMLRGIDPGVTRANLDGILTAIDARGLPAILAGLPAPPNYPADYRRAYKAMFRDLAEAHGASYYSSFFAGMAEGRNVPQIMFLFQSDRLHPHARGVQAIVDHIGPVVLELVAEARER
jgi:acyl-CoA thioesterase-1